MTRAAFNHSRSSIAPHDHAVFVYDVQDEILPSLEQFVRGGVEAGELPVFVHSFPAASDALAFLARNVLEAPSFAQRGDIVTSGYQDAFEREGRIDHEHVGSVVASLQEAARSGGRRAPRIFVDASKNYFDAGRTDEWFAFEGWLGPRLTAECGLVCAYRASDLADPKVLQRVLETHAYRFAATRRR
ncbi:MAG TPA: MEDS domain-containing protein [Candidatus Thermoplasmatota archaeon]|nr:MEDS domain-containing protein [Candidatus Thermoplasmatota archaeon]